MHCDAPGYICYEFSQSKCYAMIYINVSFQPLDLSITCKMLKFASMVIILFLLN